MVELKCVPIHLCSEDWLVFENGNQIAFSKPVSIHIHHRFVAEFCILIIEILVTAYY